jgi:hypothetical protein
MREPLPTEVLGYVNRGGYLWTHRLNELWEYYDIRDSRGWYWWVFQHLQGMWARKGWLAMLITDKGGCKMLNTRTYQSDGTVDCDGLADVPAVTAIPLLDAIGEHIRAGTIPLDVTRPASEFPPLRWEEEEVAACSSPAAPIP